VGLEAGEGEGEAASGVGEGEVAAGLEGIGEKGPVLAIIYGVKRQGVGAALRVENHDGKAA
jgi:hypothetical protein